MTTFVDKKKIIELKEADLSNREVSRELGCDRGTVSKYWKEYQQALVQLEATGADIKEI